jgi:hypothetical protein
MLSDGIPQLGWRLQITDGEVVGFAVMQAPITEQSVIRWRTFQPCGQRLDGGSGRRRHTAQQRQGGVAIGVEVIVLAIAGLE